MNTPEELDGGRIEAQGEDQAWLMDETDRKLLSIIQSGFPIEPRPYAALGEMLDLGETEVLERVRSLRKKKIIRRLGANFSSAKLGFRSTLCAAKVPEDRLEEFIAAVNARPGVTHNYLRKHDYNVWFTLIAPLWETALQELKDLSAATGVEILNLPATRMYKIKVDFNLE